METNISKLILLSCNKNKIVCTQFSQLLIKLCSIGCKLNAGLLIIRDIKEIYSALKICNKSL